MRDLRRAFMLMRNAVRWSTPPCSDSLEDAAAAAAGGGGGAALRCCGRWAGSLCLLSPLFLLWVGKGVQWLALS